MVFTPQPFVTNCIHGIKWVNYLHRMNAFPWTESYMMWKIPLIIMPEKSPIYFVGLF